MIFVPLSLPLQRVEVVSVRSKCPYFSSRVDYQDKHIIACIYRLEGISGSVKATSAENRDQYYREMCCGRYDECPVRRAIRLSLQVKHPGFRAAYSIYTDLLNGE